MATNGNALITELSRRLRDPNNDRHSRALVLSVLSQCQRVLNHYRESKIASVSFTPASGRTLYQNSAIAADVSKILAIQQDGRDLIHIPDWRELGLPDPQWLRRQGRRYEMFARVGGSLFALIPALDAPQSVTVDYVVVPAAIVDGATPIDIVDSLVPTLLDMGELVFAAKNRKPESVKDVLARFSASMQVKPGFS